MDTSAVDTPFCSRNVLPMRRKHVTQLAPLTRKSARCYFWDDVAAEDAAVLPSAGAAAALPSAAEAAALPSAGDAEALLSAGAAIAGLMVATAILKLSASKSILLLRFFENSSTTINSIPH